MPFELFQKRGQRGRYSFPVVTIQASGGIGLNDVAYEELGKPNAVRMYFDRETARIGIEAAASSDRHAYPVRPSGGASFTCSVRSFVNYYGIDASKTRRYRGGIEDNMLVVDLRKEPIHVRGKAEERQIPTGDGNGE